MGQVRRLTFSTVTRKALCDYLRRLVSAARPVRLPSLKGSVPGEVHGESLVEVLLGHTVLINHLRKNQRQARAKRLFAEVWAARCR